MVNSDENGEPTGVVSEAAVNWVRMNIPESSDETLVRWYKRATEEMIKLGITSVQTDDLGIVGSTDRIFRLYEQMDGKMPPDHGQWNLRDETGLSALYGYHQRNGIGYFFGSSRSLTAQQPRSPEENIRTTRGSRGHIREVAGRT